MVCQVPEADASDGFSFYSHRTPPTNSTVQLYFSMFKENLVQKNVGGIHSLYQELNPLSKMPCDGLLDDVKTLAESVWRNTAHCVASNFSANGLTDLVLLGDNWGVELSISLVKSLTEKALVSGLGLSLICLDLDKGKDFLKQFLALGFREASLNEDASNVSITFAFPSANGIDFRSRVFPKISISAVQQNYEPQVITKIKGILNNIESTTNGIIILNGPPGTGKTFLIRAILSELMASRTALICLPSTTFLTNMGMLTDVFGRFEKSIVIFEDVGSILEMDAPTMYADQRSNLLNMTDGLLTLLSDTVVIVSFNHDVDRSNLDPALFRPGRCLGHIVVSELPHEQAQGLVGFTIPKRKYTLADVYQMRRDGKVLESGGSPIGLVR